MTETIYVFAWGNNARRAELQGRHCRQLARGALGTVLVEFLDTGERVTCSFRALRTVGGTEVPIVDGGSYLFESIEDVFKRDVATIVPDASEWSIA